MKRLVVCVLLVGCGGDGGGPIALDDLGRELGLASCGKQFDCCTDAEIMEQYMGITYDDQPITTEAQCVELTTAFFTAFAVGQYQDSLAMGRIEYDGAAAGGCIAAIEDLTCAQFSMDALDEASSPCRPFLIPKVADGGGCTQNYECTSKNCVGAIRQPNGPDTDGMCQPMPAEGQRCDENCADGLYCGFDLSTGMEVCLALKADGAQCGLDRECASEICDDATDTCASEPLICDGR